MKSCHFYELQSLCRELQYLVGSKLQNVESGEDWLSFFFYKSEVLACFLDLSPQRPLFLPVHRPKFLKKKVKPLLLFLKAHFLNKRLLEIFCEESAGRILWLKFESGAQIEIRLFPHGQNCIASAADKKMSYFKPKPLVASPMSDFSLMPIRNLQNLIHEWQQEILQWPVALGLAEKSRAPQEQQKESQLPRDFAIKKKQRALEMIDKDILNKKNQPYKKIADWMKLNQTLQVPTEWISWIDSKKTFSQNLQWLYSQAKANDEKIEKAQRRRDELERQITSISEAPTELDTETALKTSPHFMKTAQVQGRTVTLTSGHLLYVGKSAEDNLRLLRKAQPWDLWLHVKDQPSSHGFIKKNKNEKLSDAILIEALRAFLKIQYKGSTKNEMFYKIDCLICECRYVKPIKGDRLGRVTVQNERVFRVSLIDDKS